MGAKGDLFEAHYAKFQTVQPKLLKKAGQHLVYAGRDLQLRPVALSGWQPDNARASLWVRPT